MQWFKPEDKLPTPDTDVLVLTQKYNVYVVTKYRQEFDYVTEEWIPHGWYDIFPDTPKYWAYIDPPQEPL
jgi:hypothetical protein